MAKLKGVARESVRDKQFSKIKELIAHLKKRFAPTKKYQWYFESIVNLRMKQSETVSDYNDRVQGLLSGARHAIEEKYTGTYGHTKESIIMMKPVVDCALDAFIRGLPDDISIFVDTRNPKDLSEAFEHALHAEERHKYSEKNSMASSYHIARPRERVFECPRSPSPFSKQMDNSEKYAKSEGSSLKGNTTTLATTRPNPNMAMGAMYGPSAYSRSPSHYPPLQSDYPPQYPYPFHQYPLHYPYPHHYSYPHHHPMAPYPQIDKNQKSLTDHPWQSQERSSGNATPPRPASPGPSGNLNFQPTRRLDVTTGHATPRERPRSIRFQENSVGSFEQDAAKKTHQ